MEKITQEFIEQCITVVEKKNLPKMIKCIDQLSEEQVWMRPNKVSNSIANIILHLCGNIRQYAISALGDQPDVRERDKEFSTTGGYKKEELLKKLTDTLREAINIISNTDEVKLMKIYPVQGSSYSGIGIIVHVTEHFSHHTGQVIFWTKQLTGKGLGFYSHVDLNKKNNA